MSTVQKDKIFTDYVFEQFKNGEFKVKLGESLIDKVVIVKHSVSTVSDILKIGLIVDALHERGCEKVHLFAPWLGYSRQDRLTDNCHSISARVVAKMIQSTGVESIKTIQVHSDKIKSFYSIPFTSIDGTGLVIDQIKSIGQKDLYIVGPDEGSFDITNKIAGKLKVEFCVAKKTRNSDGSLYIDIREDLTGKNVLIYDDMIDTGGTIVAASKIAKKMGANTVTICTIHGIFSGNSLVILHNLLDNDVIQGILVTDSISNKYPSRVNVMPIHKYSE